MQSMLIEGGLTDFDTRLKIVRDALPLDLILQLEKALPQNISEQEKKDKMLEAIQFILKGKGYNPIDILAFFDSVSLLMHPRKFAHLFKVGRNTLVQHVEKTFPLVLSKTLENKNLEKIEGFLGYYSERELYDYFRILGEGLQSLSANHQIALVLRSKNHAITIGYDPARGWLFSDPNQLPVQLIKNNQQMANKVLAAFSEEPDEGVMLSTDIYTIAQYRNTVAKGLNHVKQDPRWADLHTITVEKAQSENMNWLIFAVINDHIQVVKDLLDCGANPDQKNEFKTPPLHAAVLKDNIDIVRLLVEYEANPNIMDREQNTALDVAALMGNIDIVKLLIESKANPNLGHILPLDYAVQEGYMDVIELLLPLTRIDDQNLETLLKAASNKPKIRALLLEHHQRQAIQSQHVLSNSPENQNSPPRPAPRQTLAKSPVVPPVPTPRSNPPTSSVPIPRSRRSIPIPKKRTMMNSPENQNSSPRSESVQALVKPPLPPKPNSLKKKPLVAPKPDFLKNTITKSFIFHRSPTLATPVPAPRSKPKPVPR